MQRRRFLALASGSSLAGLALVAGGLPRMALAKTPTREPILGLPCEGCEAVFAGLPDDIAARARIAPVGEPGAPLALSGVVSDLDGRPCPGIVVYAYHTNRAGRYPLSLKALAHGAFGHGRLRGWARTDARGRYAFDTIRPGSYPGREVPEHIHMHVIEPGRGTYYIDDVMFRDDPKLTPEKERQISHGRGGNGVVAPVRRDGVWQVRRDIVLGRNIPGYRA